MADIAAQLDLEIAHPTGAVEPYVVRLMVPTPCGNDWQCDVRFDGPPKLVRPIYGVDLWQALTLALDFVRVSLLHAVPPGCQLLHLREPADVASLFPRFGHG